LLVGGQFTLNRCVVGERLRLFLAHLLLDLEAAQLASRRTRQVLLPNLVTQDALGWRQRGRDAFDIEADHLASVDDLLLAEDVEIRNDDSVQALAFRFTRLSFQADNANLLDPR